MTLNLNPKPLGVTTGKISSLSRQTGFTNSLVFRKCAAQGISIRLIREFYDI